MKSTYLSCAETAKLVRAALKKGFPGVKFSVRSDTYSMGASIRVNWTDGPCTAAVRAITGQFSGSGFDGMIDMKHSHSSWLMPDGTACVASDPGTSGSMGMHPPVRNWMPDPEAKLVHFGADYVFTNRALSPALLNRVRDRLAAKGYPVEAVEVLTSDYDGSGYLKLLTYKSEATRWFDMEREVYGAAEKTHCTVAAKEAV
jgi:hypothetical protein